MKNNTQIQNISFLRIGASLPNVKKDDLWMLVLYLCQQQCHLAVMSEAEKRAAMKSCVCWAGHHPQMLTPLSLCQQLLGAKICHLDCLCYLAAKMRWACINNIISKSMLISWIWSQMTVPYRRGSSEPCVEETLHSSIYQSSYTTRDFRFMYRRPIAVWQQCEQPSCFWRL